MKVVRAMKVVNVQATFPQLKGGNAGQQGRGEGCNVTSATRAAIADMFSHIKVRKTFTEFTAKFQVRDADEERITDDRNGTSQQNQRQPTPR